MHCQIDLAGKHRHLEFLGEQSFPADLCQGHVQNLIAGGDDMFKFHYNPRIHRPETFRNIFRLPERQLTAARTDDDFWFHSVLILPIHLI